MKNKIVSDWIESKVESGRCLHKGILGTKLLHLLSGEGENLVPEIDGEAVGAGELAGGSGRRV